MTIHNNTPLLGKSLNTIIIIFAGLLFFIGCGGGGGGGGTQPIITPENKIPTATISSPTGVQFNEGENIAFGGSATDEEDGDLDGDALVWTSSIDGTIGTGTAITTSALTIGDHEITLTATDSDGGEHTTAPTLITIAQTRFIKMGAETTGVTDASNAFDGDFNTAATIMSADGEVIHFKSFINTEPVFFFQIKMGPTSVAGSRLIIEGMAEDQSWQPVNEFYLLAEKTETVRILDAQNFVDSEGYIHLRAKVSSSQATVEIAVHEIWRVDLPNSTAETQEVVNPVNAFDGSTSSHATINVPWNPIAPQGNRNFLNFRVYVGVEITDTFVFDILTNILGPAHNYSMEVGVPGSGGATSWELVETLQLNTDQAQRVTISDVQKYLDSNGYITLRGSWVTVSTQPPADTLKVYEVTRIDPFFVGPKSILDWIDNPIRAIDADANSYASLYYFWGEFDRYDFLHLKSYLGDSADFSFSVKTGSSNDVQSAEVIVEGELEPDVWSEIERITLDEIKTTEIDLPTPRQYVNPDGCLSLRIRWISDSLQVDAFVFDVRRKAN